MEFPSVEIPVLIAFGTGHTQYSIIMAESLGDQLLMNDQTINSISWTSFHETADTAVPANSYSNTVAEHKVSNPWAVILVQTLDRSPGGYQTFHERKFHQPELSSSAEDVVKFAQAQQTGCRVQRGATTLRQTLHAAGTLGIEFQKYWQRHADCYS